jgi:RNAse (barnase) inhibitor barstar
MAEVTLDTEQIHDWETFHTQSAEAFGFPDFYGKNMNAWIDCLTYLPEGDGMSQFTLAPTELLFIRLTNFESFSQAQTEICLALLECTAFVNQRYISVGDIPRLVIVPL